MLLAFCNKSKVTYCIFMLLELAYCLCGIVFFDKGNIIAAYCEAGLIGKTLTYNEFNAGEYFEKALEFLRVIPSSENEQAITYLNMADLAVIELGNEESESVVEDYIKNSYDLLEKSYNDGNQDFKMTAEKCIPVIRHYGYFVYANTLQEHLSN